MRPKKLLWRIYLSFFACTVTAFVAAAWNITASFRAFYSEQVGAGLLNQSRIIADEIGNFPADGGAEAIDGFCKKLGRLTQTRITVIAINGRVLGDSDEKPDLMENHIDRPEIAAAIRGETGKMVRFSGTLKRTMMYLAVPVWRNGKVAAVVRTSVPLAVIDWNLHAAYKHVLLATSLIALLFAAVTLLILRRISRPIDEMRKVAEKLARGELESRAPESDYEETRALARAMNQMAIQLGERMRVIMQQRNEQEAAFTSMAEGLLAIDNNGRILRLNPAAARLLEVNPENARGRSIQETIRNPDLQKFASEALARQGVLEREIVLYGKEDRFIQLHGTALKDASGANIGAIVVFSDITRLKRLETVRRDFVANVSHELKTPITALKGCIETLLNETTITESERANFMGIMARHANRMEAIVGDLLSLSQIECDAERGRVQLEPGSIADVLRGAARTFGDKARQRRISLEVDCPEDLRAPINAPLLEQAVGNLVDNAIKYSGESASVKIRGRAQGGDVEISVTDSGIGIENKHLPRIFERFYRVDQARSRALGGTGLGLAIVRHIALAHGGSVAADSIFGRGSTFTIRFPRA